MDGMDINKGFAASIVFFVCGLIGINLVSLSPNPVPLAAP